MAQRREGVTSGYDGDRRLAGRRGFARHGLVPALAAVCVAVLVSAHLAAIQQPAWASSMPDTALPIPGVVPDLPGGVSGSTHGTAARPASTAVTPKAATSTAVTTPPLAPVVATTVTTSAARPPAGAVTTKPTATTVLSPKAPSSKPATDPDSSAATGAPTKPAPATTQTAVTTAAPPATSSAPPSTSAPATSKAAAPAASSVKVSAFGDSVLLGASKAVRAVVGSMSLDAVVGRQAWDTLADVAEAQKAGRLAAVVLIHTGNNGVISGRQLASTLAGLQDRAKVVVVNDHVDRTWQGPNNKTIASVNGKYPNVAIVDWNAAASKNPGWFGPDGIHVNGSGAKAYASLIAAAIG